MRFTTKIKESTDKYNKKIFIFFKDKTGFFKVINNADLLSYWYLPLSESCKFNWNLVHSVNDCTMKMFNLQP